MENIRVFMQAKALLQFNALKLALQLINRNFILLNQKKVEIFVKYYSQNDELIVKY